MITTDHEEFAQRMRIFRNHGITTDHRQREQQGSWFYEMTELGYNYRITDFQCALGISQLKKLPKWIARRQEIAAIYDEAFAAISGIKPLGLRADMIFAKEYANLSLQNPMPLSPSLLPSIHAYHLYVVRLDEKLIGKTRQDIFTGLRNAGVGVNVHYIPVHLHPFYRNAFKYHRGLCPVAEAAYEKIISLPMFVGLSNDQQNYIIETLHNIIP
jgi:perosamine synthetase